MALGVKGKIEMISATIERLVEAACIEDGNPLQELDIVEKAFKDAKLFYSPRESNTVFDFLTGGLAKDYVNKRFYTHILKILLSWESFDDMSMQKLSDILGISKDENIRKNFKGHFGKTPKQLHIEYSEQYRKTRECPLIQGQMSWDSLSDEIKETVREELEVNTKTKSIFDVDQDVLRIAMEAEGLKEFYDLSEQESHMAKELFTQYGYTLKDCYRYVYEGKQNFSQSRTDLVSLYRLEDLRNDDILYLYFDERIGFKDILRILGNYYPKFESSTSIHSELCCANMEEREARGLPCLRNHPQKFYHIWGRHIYIGDINAAYQRQPYEKSYFKQRAKLWDSLQEKFFDHFQTESLCVEIINSYHGKELPYSIEYFREAAEKILNDIHITGNEVQDLPPSVDFTLEFVDLVQIKCRGILEAKVRDVLNIFHAVNAFPRLRRNLNLDHAFDCGKAMPDMEKANEEIRRIVNEYAIADRISSTLAPLCINQEKLVPVLLDAARLDKKRTADGWIFRANKSKEEYYLYNESHFHDGAPAISTPEEFWTLPLDDHWADCYVELPEYSYTHPNGIDAEDLFCNPLEFEEKLIRVDSFFSLEVKITTLTACEKTLHIPDAALRSAEAAARLSGNVQSPVYRFPGIHCTDRAILRKMVHSAASCLQIQA